MRKIITFKRDPRLFKWNHLSKTERMILLRTIETDGVVKIIGRASEKMAVELNLKGWGSYERIDERGGGYSQFTIFDKHKVFVASRSEEC